MIDSEIVAGPPAEAFAVLELCAGTCGRPIKPNRVPTRSNCSIETPNDHVYVANNVFPCLLGGNLADVINSAGPGGRGLSESRIWDIFFQVCSAVSILHEQKPVVVHRDIKAENVLICEQDGTYKLCDFGSAKREMVFPAGDVARNAIAEDIDRYTTMVYRAPEMLDLYLEKWIGDKVDIWALGCLLFKMAYIVTPFEEAGRLGILNARVEFPQTVNSSTYSENLRSTIKWLLTPDPEERPDIFDVLERISKYARVTYNRNGKKGPQHPADPEGYGESVGGTTTSKSTSKKSSVLSSLDWQSSDSAPANSSSQMQDFFATPSNDFFSSSPNVQISFDSSAPSGGASGGSDWANFGADSNQQLFDSGSTTSSMTPDPFGSGHSSFTPSMSSSASSQQHQSASSSRSGSSRSHRRSVSDTGAITASLAAMQLNQNRPAVVADLTRLPPLISSFVTADSRIPASIVAKELIAYSWASPKEQHVSKMFQSVASKIGAEQSPAAVLKGLHLVHRLIAEGSPLVLTLCINKLEWFRTLAKSLAELPASSSPAELGAANARYAAYLVKRLELHHVFEGCFEGSYSLDVYFAKLRAKGKKLQIGAADSPFRRQAVPALLECQVAALSLAEALLTPHVADPNISSLKLHLALPVLSDLCAALLVLQFVTTKLLATKRDFSKAIATYDDQYTKILGIFKTFKMIATQPLSVGFPATELAWAKSIKIPAFSPAAPPITKVSGTSTPPVPTASPPSLDPSLKSSASIAMPNAIIYEPLPEAIQKEVDWIWQSFVSTSSIFSPAPVTPSGLVAPMPTAASSGVFLSHSSDALSVSAAHPDILRVSGSFESSSGTPPPSFTPGYSQNAFSTPPAQAYTPPPAFSVSNATPSFDPFNASTHMASSNDSLSVSGGSGFTQGDPFQMVASPSAPVVSASGNIDFNTFAPSSSAGGLFAPSSGGSASFATTFDDEDPFSATPTPGGAHFGSSDPFAVQAAPKRALAASADHQVPSNHFASQSTQSPSVFNVQQTHKKRGSDPQNNSALSASGSSSSAAGWMSSSSSLTSEDKLKNKEYMAAQANEFLSIQSQPANSKCFDCGDNLPKWLSLNLGVFICFRCSGIHRSFGTHISKVRSIDLDVLTPEQIAIFKRMGNAKAADVWLANVPDERSLPDRNTAQSELERFLRDKYVFEEFKDKDAAASAEEDNSHLQVTMTPARHGTKKKTSHSRTKSHQ